MIIKDVTIELGRSDHVSVLVPDIFFVRLYEAVLIKYLAVQFEFKLKDLAEIVKRTRVISSD